MKIEFEVKQLDELPGGWSTTTSWPGPGVYVCKTEPRTLYFVGDYAVGYAIDAVNLGRKIEGPSEGALPETLVLKLLAAAARAEVLK